MGIAGKKESLEVQFDRAGSRSGNELRILEDADFPVPQQDERAIQGDHERQVREREKGPTTQSKQSLKHRLKCVYLL